MRAPTASPSSLRRRLLALVVAGGGAAWIAITAATYVDARYHMGQMLDAQLVEYAEVLGAIANHEALEIAGATTRHDPAYVQSCTYQVYSLDGSLLMRSHDAPNSALAPAEGFSDVRAANTNWRAYRRTDRSHGVVIIVAHAVAQRDALVAGLALRLLVPILVGLPLLAIALWLAVTRALRPLEDLAREVKGREARNLAPIQAPEVPAEVAPLVAETNDLLARLSRSFANERRFTGDAAHELRTPLAALRTQAEVALTTATEERRRRALEQVVAGVERATRVVEQMLLLARLDAADGVPLAPVPLAATCREAIAEAAPPARARSVDVVLDAPDELVAKGDRVMLLAVVRNLVDNASLAVEDSGPGVPPEQRDRIFDRFFRGPEGRGTGSGLGLSIVRRVVELHGGTLAATSSPSLGGLRVEVRLPLEP